jgi:sulfate adenylyltransferase
MVFSQNLQSYMPIDELASDDAPLRLSGTTFRTLLCQGEPIPDWFSFPEVIQELRPSQKNRTGCVIFFTGLPCAGKTTIARLLQHKLLEMNVSDVHLLDGDVVRSSYRRKLGFSRKDRITNITRMGVRADAIARKGGVAICAAVAPHEQARNANRKRISARAPYIEVFVNTPLEVCETRDTKGLYRKAREGLIQHFTGIDDVYEIPHSPEITVDTTRSSPEACADIVFEYLKTRGVL